MRLALNRGELRIRKEERTMRLFRPNVPKLRENRDVVGLVKALRDNEAMIRVDSAKALGETGDARAVDPLAMALHDCVGDVCCAAIEALAKIGSPAAVEPLCAVLDYTDPSLRRAAVQALAKIGDSRARNAIVGLLLDSSPEVLLAAATALERIGIPDDPATRARYYIIRQDWISVVACGDAAVQPLCWAFQSRSAETREAAAEALGRIGAAAAEPLCGFLEGRDPVIREAATQVLGLIGAAAVGPVCRLLGAGAPKARCVSVALLERLSGVAGAQATVVYYALIDRALGSEAGACEAVVRIGAPIVNLLIRVLQGDLAGDLHARCRAAVELLGDIGDARAVEPLGEALRYRYYYVRQAAAEALGRIGDARAVAPLCAALHECENDDDGRARQAVADVGHAALVALAKIGGPSVEPLCALLEGAADNSKTAARAEDALIRIGSPAVAAVCKACRQQDGKKGFREVIRNISGPPPDDPELRAWYYVLRKEWKGVIPCGELAVPPLLTALVNDDPRVCLEAAMALGNIGDARAVPLLTEALQHHDAWIRKTAAETLGGIRGVRPPDPLVGMLADPDADVRKTARKALERMDPDWPNSTAAHAAVPSLIVALAARGWDVKAGAAEALGRIQDGRACRPLMELLHSLASADRITSWDLRKAVSSALLSILRAGNLDEDLRAPAKQAIIGWHIACDRWDSCVEYGASAVEPLIAELGSHSWSRRKGAAEALVRIYLDGGIDEPMRLRILKFRTRLSETHTDDHTWYQIQHTDEHSSSDCVGHTDNDTGIRHSDSGIGVEFNPDS